MNETFCDVCDMWVPVNDDGELACGHYPDDEGYEYYAQFDENGDLKPLDFGDD